MRKIKGKDKGYHKFIKSPPIVSADEINDFEYGLEEYDDTELIEDNDNYIIKFLVPEGVYKEDIQLVITSAKITIRFEKKDEIKIEKKGFFRDERIYQAFYKVIALPSEVNPQNSKTKYSQGSVEIMMPKSKDKRKRKKEF